MHLIKQPGGLLQMVTRSESTIYSRCSSLYCPRQMFTCSKSTISGYITLQSSPPWVIQIQKYNTIFPSSSRFYSRTTSILISPKAHTEQSMSDSSLSPDLIVATLFGLLQVLVGLMSLWQQRRFCQISSMF